MEGLNGDNMKVVINGYEVLILAKHVWQRKATKQATLEFLNELSIIYSEASEFNNNKNYTWTATAYRKASDDLYGFNNKQGLYNQ